MPAKSKQHFLVLLLKLLVISRELGSARDALLRLCALRTFLFFRRSHLVARQASLYSDYGEAILRSQHYFCMLYGFKRVPNFRLIYVNFVLFIFVFHFFCFLLLAKKITKTQNHIDIN